MACTHIWLMLQPNAPATRAHALAADLASAPNLITLARILLVLVGAILFSEGERGWGIALGGLAGITDTLDGIVARATGRCTWLGQILDKFADLVFESTSLVLLAVVARRLPAGFLLAFIVREFWVATVRAFLARYGVIVPPSFLGKASASILMIGFLPSFLSLLDLPTAYSEALAWLGQGLVGAGIAGTLVTAALYTRSLIDAYGRIPPPPAPNVAAAPAGRAGPAVLIATWGELPGARMGIAGLPVVTRTLREIDGAGFWPIGVITDGSFELPPLPPGAIVERVAAPSAVVSALASYPGRVFFADRIATEVQPGSPPSLRVIDEPSRRQAEDSIFRSLLRADLGLVARHLNKPISIRLTRHLLCRLPVTPNQITLAAGVIGVVGCALVASGPPWLIVLGFLLAHVHSVLDGCDGELARVRFQSTLSGEWLDTVVDDLVTALLILATGVALHRGDGTSGVLLAGIAGAFAFFVGSAIRYTLLIEQETGGEAVKCRWWFTGGRPMKEIVGRASRGVVATFLYLGRRDSFVLGWLLLAVAGLLPSVLVTGLMVAVAHLGASIGELAARRRRAPSPGPTTA